jgi:uncharacterized protein (DUF2236 family)
MPLRPVSASELESLIDEVRSSVTRPEEGIFGADSISWRINRESALFLAAGRAALLQLAHPWVGAAIAQHSRTLNDPIGRFHHTFRVIFTMVFGPAENAFAAARQLHRLHQAIAGTLPAAAGRFGQGTPYEANEVSALRWVYATLVESAVVAYELMFPPLSDSERDQYISESLRMASLFGISHEHLPGTWAEFREYVDSTVESGTLGVSEATRTLARRLHDGAGLMVGPPFWYRALTAELLPARVRQEFALPYGSREQRSTARALRMLRRLYPKLPSAVRFVGPYVEAQNRLRGRSSGLAVRLSNRVWVGQPGLFSKTSGSSAEGRLAETTRRDA